MKKGELSLEWLVELIKGILPVLLVIAIVASIFAVIWMGAKTPEDKEFGRIADAMDNVLDAYDDKKSQTAITVPIVTEKPIPIIFYPKGSLGLPAKCSGQACVCMYPIIEAGKKKETCKTVDVTNQCDYTCGGDLCSTEPASFTLTKGNAMRIEIDCTDQGSEFRVSKI